MLIGGNEHQLLHSRPATIIISRPPSQRLDAGCGPVPLAEVRWRGAAHHTAAAHHCGPAGLLQQRAGELGVDSWLPGRARSGAHAAGEAGKPTNIAPPAPPTSVCPGQARLALPLPTPQLHYDALSGLPLSIKKAATNSSTLLIVSQASAASTVQEGVLTCASLLYPVSSVLLPPI